GVQTCALPISNVCAAWWGSSGSANRPAEGECPPAEMRADSRRTSDARDKKSAHAPANSGIVRAGRSIDPDQVPKPCFAAGPFYRPTFVDSFIHIATPRRQAARVTHKVDHGMRSLAHGCLRMQKGQPHDSGNRRF